MSVRGSGVKLPPLATKKKRRSKQPKGSVVPHETEYELTPTDSDYIAFVGSKETPRDVSSQFEDSSTVILNNALDPESEIEREKEEEILSNNIDLEAGEKHDLISNEITNHQVVNVRPTSAAKTNVPEDGEVGDKLKERATVIKNKSAVQDRPSPVQLKTGETVRPPSEPEAEEKEVRDNNIDLKAGEKHSLISKDVTNHHDQIVNIEPLSALENYDPEKEEVTDKPKQRTTVIRNELADHDTGKSVQDSNIDLEAGEKHDLVSNEITNHQVVNVRPTSAAKTNVPEDEEVGDKLKEQATIIKNELAAHKTVQDRPPSTRPLSAPEIELPDKEQDVSNTEEANTEEANLRPGVQVWTDSVYDSDELEVAGGTADGDDEEGQELKVPRSFLRRSSEQGKKFKFAVTKVLLDRMANKTALDQKLKVHPTSEEGSNGNHLGPDGKNNVQSMASVAQTITFIRRISKRTGKKEPDEFLQRLNFGAAADIKENKPLSTKDKGWNCLINFFCHFVFDPFSDIYYYWLSIISLAVLYNFIIIPARISFSELEEGNFFTTWMVIDILADVLYVLDFFASFRIGFLERGLLVTDTAQLSKKYVKSVAFYIDIFSIIPTQIVYAFHLSTASIYIAPLIRLSKFFKFHRLVAWNDRTECRTSVPTLWRVVTLFTIMLMVMHWNACLYFFVSTTVIRQNPNTHPNRSKFIYPYDTDINGTKNKYASTAMKYAVSLYWSTQTMTTIGEMEQPEELWEYVYLTIIFLIGVMIFASVVGSIGNIITNLRANRSVFQDRLDHLKEYMGYRNVGKDLQNRIIRWFDYLWAQNHTFEEEDVLKYLPDKLQAEMAIHVHLATLKQVELFQNCESGFLIALVLKLKHQVYSPGDYVCRKGDIGREMFIVKQGMLQVTADDGRALATLSDGSYFGEISLLNVGKNGNRRTANVRSVGYSDLFCLRKEDLLHALNDYPEMREVLKEAARQKLARDAKPQQDEDTTENERRISFTNSVELADTLGKRLEDLEKLVLTLAKEIKTTNKSVLTLQKQLTKVYPNSKSDSSSSSSSDDES